MQSPYTVYMVFVHHALHVHSRMLCHGACYAAWHSRWRCPTSHNIIANNSLFIDRLSSKSFCTSLCMLAGHIYMMHCMGVLPAGARR